MGRPQYETKLDLKNEADVADFFASKTNSTWSKVNKVLYPFDVAFHRANQVVAFAEIKCREAMFNPILLSASKYQRLCFWADSMRQVPTMLLFSYTDVVYSFDMRKYSEHEAEVTIEMAGRVDRGDDEDIEPCVMLPHTMFTVWKL